MTGHTHTNTSNLFEDTWHTCFVIMIKTDYRPTEKMIIVIIVFSIENRNVEYKQHWHKTCTSVNWDSKE